jgi:hypothetical protein
LTTTGQRVLSDSGKQHIMSSVSIIGLGGMARAIGARAIVGGNTVEVIGRDAAKAGDLAAALGGGATAGTFGTTPAGDLVILAVPYDGGVPVVAQYGDALAGKVIIDISNTFAGPDDTVLVTPEGSSGAQEIAKAAPAVPHGCGHAGPSGVQPHHSPDPRLGARSARPARRSGQRPLLPR